MHPDERAFVARILETPDDRTPRLVFADWLDEHGEDPVAAVIRAPDDLAARVAAARHLEAREGCAGLGAFADAQRRVEEHRGEPTDAWQAMVDWTYGELARRWRSWLPAGVTLLTRRAPATTASTTAHPIPACRMSFPWVPGWHGRTAARRMEGNRAGGGVKQPG